MTRLTLNPVLSSRAFAFFMAFLVAMIYGGLAFVLSTGAVPAVQIGATGLTTTLVFLPTWQILKEAFCVPGRRW